MKKLKLALFVSLTILLLSSCLSYNSLSLKRAPLNSVSKETTELSEKTLKPVSQEISVTTDSKKTSLTETRLVKSLVSRTENKTIVSTPTLVTKGLNSQETPKKLKDLELVQRKPSDTPPCSTIVLTNGTTIQARNIKVTASQVSFRSCDKDEVLFVERSSVEQIIATTKSDLIQKGVSEGRMKDRYTNFLGAIYFIGTLVLITFVVILYLEGIYLAGFFLGAFAAALGLLLITSTLIDLSTVRGITYSIAGFVLNSLLAVFSLYYHIYEN